MKLRIIFGTLGLFFCMTVSALAGEGTIDSGDTAWLIVSTALVMMMTPAGLALFYGGMSRYKNLLNTLAIWGALATGIFANPAVTEGAKGLLYGNAKQLWIQLISIIGTAAYSAVGTIVVIAITHMVTGGLRVDKDSEIGGLDQAVHGERGFEMPM
jgi:ammonia channel protein AmtB